MKIGEGTEGEKNMDTDLGYTHHMGPRLRAEVERQLFVFWQFLHFGENTEDVVRAHGGIPQHIWQSLPESSKDLCLKSETYDAAWANDPLVLQWRDQRSQ